MTVIAGMATSLDGFVADHSGSAARLYPDLGELRHTAYMNAIIEQTGAVLMGKRAGFVMVVGDEVEQVYVAAPHRGTGVADMLMAEAERRVGRNGHATAWLAVVAGNARARRFYERRGWSDTGSFNYAAAGENGPISVPSRRYVKHLS